MSETRLSEAWLAARHLLVAHLGTERDVLALGPALEVLRAELRGVRLTLLTSLDGLRAAPYLSIDAACKTDALAWPEHLARLVGRLGADSFGAAIVFTAEGSSPYEVAYAAYLAGIGLRLGASSEFGGGVLNSWVLPPPPGTPPAARHLHLLAEAGFAQARLLVPQRGGNKRPGTSTREQAPSLPPCPPVPPHSRKE